MADPREEAEKFNASVTEALSQDGDWKQKAKLLNEANDEAFRRSLNKIYSSHREFTMKSGPDRGKYKGLNNTVLHRAIVYGLQMEPEPSGLSSGLSNIVSIDTEGKMAGNASAQILKMLLDKGDYSSNGSLAMALKRFKPESKMEIYRHIDAGLHQGILKGDHPIDFLVNAYVAEHSKPHKDFIKASLAKFNVDPEKAVAAEARMRDIQKQLRIAMAKEATAKTEEEKEAVRGEIGALMKALMEEAEKK